MSEVVQFESRRVGKIEVIDEDILRFESIPGFPDKKRFVVVAHADSADFAWLVCIDDPDLAFVVASPWTFFPNYDPPVDRDHLATLSIEKKEEVELLSIVTLMGKEIYLNLAAPLLINASSRRGMQVVSDDPRYTTRAALPPLKEEAKSQAASTEADSKQADSTPTASKSVPVAP